MKIHLQSPVSPLAEFFNPNIIPKINEEAFLNLNKVLKWISWKLHRRCFTLMKIIFQPSFRIIAAHAGPELPGHS
jgi:hypothetical protein